MTRILLLCMALLLVGPAWAAPVVDQTAAIQTFADPGTTTHNISFGTAPAAGSAVFICVGGGDYSGTQIDFIASGTDNQGNGAYSIVGETAVTGGMNSQVAIFYKENVASSGTFTFTLTTTNSTDLYFAMSGVSFTDIATSAALDQSATDTNDTVGSSNHSQITATTGTTTVANEVVISCAAMAGAVPSDSDINVTQGETGYVTVGVFDNPETVTGYLHDYHIVTSTAAQTSTVNFDAARHSALGVATFKEDVGGGGGAETFGFRKRLFAH